MNENQHLYQRVYVSREYFFDDFFDRVKTHVALDFAKEGGEVKLWYLTFLEDGWRSNLITYEAFSKATRDKLVIVAPEDEFDSAVQWVKDNNRHLIFSDVVEKGYNNDDFAKNRLSGILKFKIA